jgi:hypothetical protein
MWTALLLNFAVIPLTIPPLFVIGSQFMPPLYEGSMLYMPTSPPGMSINKRPACCGCRTNVAPRAGSPAGVRDRRARHHADRQHADGHGQ